MAGKSREKSPRKLFVKGGKQGPGRGPAKGAPNAGRPPDEFKAIMAGLASRDTLIEKLEEILEDSTHPHFIQAMKHVTEHGYGRAKETVEKMGGTDNSLTVTFRNE